MKSKWDHLKEEICSIRRQGTSMTVIERRFGIARSTLSGWFRDIELTESQRTRLMKNSRDGWAKARRKAVIAHNNTKRLRLQNAKDQATKVMDKLTISDELLELTLAMLYWGEGAKKDSTYLGSSDPRILRFFITILHRNYNVTDNMLRCDLHLRMDQDADELKLYWSHELGVSIDRFKYASFDHRTAGKATYSHYKGVCMVRCADIAIQRKLIYLYNLFCDKVTESESGT